MTFYAVVSAELSALSLENLLLSLLLDLVVVLKILSTELFEPSEIVLESKRFKFAIFGMISQPA